MKTILIKSFAKTLLPCLAAFALGCSSSEASDRLMGGDQPTGTPGPAPAGTALTGHEETTPQTVNVQPEEVTQAPEIYARFHACGKIPVRAIGRILQTRGVQTSGTAYSFYEGGRTALGEANYPSRTPEGVIASTANLTKQFDILVAAAPEMIAGLTDPNGGCPGVVLYDAAAGFTKDGLACLMGKPAKPEHVFLANQAVKDAQAQGIGVEDAKSLAVAAILQAAHTCE